MDEGVPVAGDARKPEIVSSDEQEVVAYLREHYYDEANKASCRLDIKDGIYRRYVKRVVDILVSLVVLIVTLPFNLVFALITFVDVGRPVIFKQERTGRGGKSFTMIKLRNMKELRDESGELLPASQRVTRFGHFMRKYSLDELLNFWSVLKGDMSIIGPRPYPTFFTERMTDRHKLRHELRPGIECPKMITLSNESERLYNVKLENDLWYVENCSFRTDLRMVGRLVGMVLNFKVRNKHAGSLSYFVGYDDQGYALGMREAVEFLEGSTEHGVKSS